MLDEDEVKEFPGTFPGTVKAPMDVPFLTDSADVVCKGAVVYIHDEGETKFLVGGEPMLFRRMVAVFRVDGIYKGTISELNIEVEFLLSDVPSSLESLHLGQYVMVFLVQKKKRYRFANLTSSKMLISKGPDESIDGKSSPLKRICKELIRSLGDPNGDVILVAIEQLGQLGSIDSIEALQPFVDSQDTVLSGAAIAALLSIGDLSQIDAAVKYIEEIKADVPALVKIKESIYDAIAHFQDSALIDPLIPLVRHRDSQLRYAAVRFLRHIKADSTAPTLLTLLDDVSEDVRYQALMALAEMARHTEWGATVDEFRRDEAKYINKLKAWWLHEVRK